MTSQPKPVVLASPAASHVAEALGLEVITSPLEAGGRPLIVVVSAPDEVSAAHRIVSGGDVHVAAVITWHLRTAALVNAVSIPVPVHVGLPEPNRVMAFLNAGVSNKQAQMNESARAEALSKMLLRNAPKG